MRIIYEPPNTACRRPGCAGGYAGRKVKLPYQIELVEKGNRRVAELNSGQWLWANGVKGQLRRAPEAPVSHTF